MVEYDDNASCMHAAIRSYHHISDVDTQLKDALRPSCHLLNGAFRQRDRCTIHSLRSRLGSWGVFAARVEIHWLSNIERYQRKSDMGLNDVISFSVSDATLRRRSTDCGNM